MHALERWAGVLAMIGGSVVTLIVAMLSLQPGSAGGSATWVGLVAGICFLGAAVAGMYRRTRSAMGRLGLVSAWISGAGAAATVAAVVYFLVTGQILSVQQALPEGPVGILVMASSLAWLAGNLGFAVAVVRARSLPRLGAWLVLAGAIAPIALSPFTMDAAGLLAQLASIAFLLMPVGWIVLGFAFTRPFATQTRLAGA